MTTFAQFASRCKMRHDFDDRIQVRYTHTDDESYDTWVSGEEVLQRLRSEAAEARLRRLSRLNLDEIRNTLRNLPEMGQQRLHDEVRERLGDEIDDFGGDSLIGNSLADAMRGQPRTTGQDEDGEKALWQKHLQEVEFRASVLELAWLNLRGSFPESEEADDHDDWVQGKTSDGR